MAVTLKLTERSMNFGNGNTLPVFAYTIARDKPVIQARQTSLIFLPSVEMVRLSTCEFGKRVHNVRDQPMQCSLNHRVTPSKRHPSQYQKVDVPAIVESSGN
jgi:hypothetical protein